jgi:hypothetical protein
MAACPGEAWRGEADLVAAPSTPRKRRRLPPAQAVVYFVLGLCLFSGADSAAPPGNRSLTTFSLIPNIEAGAAARWPWVQAAVEVQ